MDKKLNEFKGKTISVAIFSFSVNNINYVRVMTLANNGEEFFLNFCPNYIKSQEILVGQVVEFVNNGDSIEVVSKYERPESQARRFEQIAKILQYVAEVRLDDEKEEVNIVRDLVAALNDIACENLDENKFYKNTQIMDKLRKTPSPVQVLRGEIDYDLSMATNETIEIQRETFQRFSLKKQSEQTKNKKKFGKDGGMFKTEY